MESPYAKQMKEWRGRVRELFGIKEEEMDDFSIDYHFLNSPQKAKLLLTDSMFYDYLMMWKKEY